MTIKKVILLTLILSCSTSYPTSNEEIRTKGIVAAGVLLTAGGTYILCRRSTSIPMKTFEIIAGAALIAAGIAGIVLSGDLAHEIENLFR